VLVFTAILLWQKSSVCCICIHTESVTALLDACQRPQSTRHRDDYEQ
jgi:hypothetical protein